MYDYHPSVAPPFFCCSSGAEALFLPFNTLLFILIQAHHVCVLLQGVGKLTSNEAEWRLAVAHAILVRYILLI
jgi:hypothetical protein